MNTLVVLGVSIILLYLGYRFYARYIEGIFQVDGTHVTPAVEVNDGIDYVPTKKFVLFGHHFASIAGGGPIIGPTVAFIFGFLPVWLWVVIGAVFVGAVHDFSALLASMREKGKSMAEIAEKTFGRTGFILFISFTIIMLLMITSVFLTLTATALSSMYPVKFFGEMAMVQTVVKGDVTYAVIGGVASTSVIFITSFAPIVGYLLYKRGLGVLPVSILAVAVGLFSIQVGLWYPIKIDPFIWMVILSFYTILAAGAPVWIILQPRDFTNSFLLYGGVLMLTIGAIVIGFTGQNITAPMVNIEGGTKYLGYIWPILFITVACGACSGFHALVAGGTTSKQISAEKPDAKYIAYGGMILESLLAVTVVIAVATGLTFDQFTSIVFPTEAGVKSNPILAFALGMGGLMETSVGIPKIIGTVFGIIMVEGFVVTTLDTAVRLNRYLFEELWSTLFKTVPKFMKSYIFNSLLAVALMFILAYYNAFIQLWALFGSANQLLSALTLLTISAWLLKKGKKYLFTFIPGIFMFITTIASLVMLLVQKYIPKMAWMMIIGDILLIGLSLGVLWMVIKSMRKKAAA
jgi:carbon starvation protein